MRATPVTSSTFTEAMEILERSIARSPASTYSDVPFTQGEDPAHALIRALLQMGPAFTEAARAATIYGAVINHATLSRLKRGDREAQTKTLVPLCVLVAMCQSIHTGDKVESDVVARAQDYVTLALCLRAEMDKAEVEAAFAELRKAA